MAKDVPAKSWFRNTLRVCSIIGIEFGYRIFKRKGRKEAKSIYLKLCLFAAFAFK